MILISTLDRFLGSLLGSYMGFYYQQTPWPALHSDPLYTAWIESPLLDLKSFDNDYLAALPWLLYRYDNIALRHHELAQHLENLSANGADINTITTLSTLYILGDSLEWLMQCQLSIQPILPKLFAYLQQQQANYPSILHGFAPLSLAAPLGTSKPSKLDNATLEALNIALAQGLNHRENLALALNSTMSRLTRTILGYLLGAWGGLSVIPTPWIFLLSPEVKQAITLFAKQLYQNWAGISSTEGPLETFPLTL